MPRKGENIYKRKDGRWEGRYVKGKSIDGKSQYGYVYAKTYQEVKAKLSSVNCTLNHKPFNPKGSVRLFGSLAAQWIDGVHPQIKESSYVKYKNLLKSYILPELGDVPIHEITHECLEHYCNQMLLAGGSAGKGLSPKTVSDTMSLVRNVLRYSSRNGYMPPDDGRSISIKQNTKAMRILSYKEQMKLCQYLYQNLNAKNMGILLCLFTGIRIGEICALKWEDISFEEKTIYIHQTMQRLQTEHSVEHKTEVVVSTPKSSCSVRKIPIPDKLFLLIAEFAKGKSGYVLTGSSQRYIEPRNMQNHFKRVLQAISVEPANYHALRHTFATRCIEVGFDVKSLSEILGHANVNITMNRYVHPSMELKRENMQRLSSLFSVR